MYGLAYVLIPKRFCSLQAELDRTLTAFKRGGEEAFPRDVLAFEDETDWLMRLHQAKFSYSMDGSLRLFEPEVSSFGLSIKNLSEHLSACRLDAFEGTFAEIEPDFDTFVRRFTVYSQPDTTTGRYGRWLNPIGYWDWWELGGRFNGIITGEQRPSGAEQAISSGPNPGRDIIGNVVAAFGASSNSEEAEIEANVELVESLKLAAKRNELRAFPTAIVLPDGCCADEHRWFDCVEWHEIKPGTRTFLEAPVESTFNELASAAYEKFADHAAAGVAYHL